jgi:PKD repeat protein
MRNLFSCVFLRINFLPFFLLLTALNVTNASAPPEMLDGDEPGPKNLIRLKIAGGLGADEMVVYFDPEASDGYDASVDAIKMLSGNPGVPNIYSRIGEDDISINVMGDFNIDKSIPVVVKVTQNGVYNISVLELNHFAPTTMVYLEDRVQNKFYNLLIEKSLNFNLITSVYTNRFFLHFKLPVIYTVKNETCRQNDGVLTFNNPSDSPWNLKLLSADGLTQIASADSVVGEHLFNGLDGGDYSLSITKPTDGYTQMIPVSINPAIALDAEFTSPVSTVKTGGVALFAAGQTANGLAYSWDMGDGTVISGQSVVEHIYTAPGVYTISLLISDGVCSDASQVSLVVLPDVVTKLCEPQCGPESVNAGVIEMFPNPVNDILSIRLIRESKEKIDWVEISDAHGRSHAREFVSGMFSAEQNIALPVSHLAAGSYFIVLTGKNIRIAKPLLITH